MRVQDWSPNSRWLLLVALPSGGPPGSLWTYTVDTGAVRRISECDFATWMKDGRRILCNRWALRAARDSRLGSRVLVVDAITGRATDLQVGTADSPRLAVDDSQLFFLQGTTSADIWIARFEQPATSRQAWADPRPAVHHHHGRRRHLHLRAAADDGTSAGARTRPLTSRVSESAGPSPRIRRHAAGTQTPRASLAVRGVTFQRGLPTVGVFSLPSTRRQRL